jgi:exodeoxyribonuclease VII large subunit
VRNVAQRQQEVARLGDRLRPALDRRLEQMRRRLETQTRVLGTLSYESVLRRGFALVVHNGALVRSAAGVKEGDLLKLRFADGEAAATAGVQPPPMAAAAGKKGAKPAEPEVEPPPRPRIRRRTRPEDQGDLF